MTPREAPPRSTPARGNLRGWADAFTGLPAACVVLAIFSVLLLASVRSKSPTYDEVAHVAAGYSYWHFGDYRLQPENGQLPQRLAGIALALSPTPLPAPDPSAWRDSDDWLLGYQWLFRSGRDPGSIAAQGRLCCALFAVALGALVWTWSRRLFGPAGAMVSLLAYALSPIVLANGALMTSDTASALFFLAATGGIWGVLGRVTPLRVASSALILSALFLTKVSALLILPIAAVLVAARLADGRPLAASGLGKIREVAGRGHQALLFLLVLGIHALVVVAVLWASYGFRYSAFADKGSEGRRFRQPWEYLLAKPGPAAALRALDLSSEQKAQVQSILVSSGASEAVWSNRTLDAMAAVRRDVLSAAQAARLDGIISRPSPEAWVRGVEAARRLHFLPEAWIYGFTDVYRRSQVRPAFLNGQFRLQGWREFFPYTFLVKTPLSVFALMALALAAALGGAGARRAAPGRPLWMRAFPALPLVSLIVIYAAAAVASHLNIGHRHLLPLYPPVFILCGAAGEWLCASPLAGRERGWGARALAAATGVSLVALMVETVSFFPNYLAYFNGIVNPREAYRHLVDSSLDWGQELPAVRAYLEQHHARDDSTYFSYFGTSSPESYGIRARPLFSVAGLDNRDQQDWKNIFIPVEGAQEKIDELRQTLARYDLLGAQRLGDTVVATFLKKPEELALGAGTYLVSASMLQPVNFDLQGPWGPWNRRYEATYRELDLAVRPLLSPSPSERITALRLHRAGEWPMLLDRFEEYRFGRLSAYLRHREPDDEINFSVLVYRLTSSELELALNGPPPELADDVLSEEKAKLPANGSDDVP